MSTQVFRIPRWNDRQVIENMKELINEFSLPVPMLVFTPFEGANGATVDFNTYENNSMLKSIIDLGEAGIYNFGLDIQQNKRLLTIRRKSDSLFDEASLNWESVRPVLDETKYACLITIAKRKFKEIKIDEALSGFPNEEINKYYEARDATLTRLESTSRQLLFDIHKRQHELDENYKKKAQDLEIKFSGQQETLQKEFEIKEQILAEKEETFKNKEAEFETHESKYIRRQLRQDLLKKLQALSEKFELTKDTRQLRTPIYIVTIIFILFFGVMTVLSFSQAVEILNAAKEDITKINWWVLGLLSLKQLAFASAFIGGVWFLIKWNDRWFRQHADAEFNFKQLELDINRASWVVEMALEWKEEKGTEIPPELLDRLTKNLFKDVSQTNHDNDNPPDVASLLLGPASSVKFKAGNGTEIEYDRKGIKKALED